jgi:hypothetical protein
MISREEFNKIPHTYVAFIDMLGVSEATKKPTMEQILKGNELETISEFVSDLCRIYPKINAYGFSDSHVLISNSFDDLILFLILLFQISVIMRDFRLRAGIEIGNCHYYEVKVPPKNYISLPFLYGDALTGAYEAEKTLKGSRIVCGYLLSELIEKKVLPKNPDYENFFKKTVLSYKENLIQDEEYKEIFTSANVIDKYVYEINWFMLTEEIKNIYKLLNEKVEPLGLNKCYHMPCKDTIENRIKRWIELSKIEPYYPQIMLGLLYSFEILK